MAEDESKPWMALDNAIADFWVDFPAADEDLVTFSENLDQDLFPRGFIAEFLLRVKGRDDPTYQFPKKVMYTLLKDMKNKQAPREEEAALEVEVEAEDNQREMRANRKRRGKGRMKHGMY